VRAAGSLPSYVGKDQSMNLGFIGLMSLAVASLLALVGTNAQARLAREQLFNDPDEGIARAGRLWRPGPRWLTRKAYREQREAAEAQVRSDPERRKRYEKLRQELWAWNALESAVAIAFSGSLLAVVGALFDR
jgi:hypothetical protein